MPSGGRIFAFFFAQRATTSLKIQGAFIPRGVFTQAGPSRHATDRLAARTAVSLASGPHCSRGPHSRLWSQVMILNSLLLLCRRIRPHANRVYLACNIDESLNQRPSLAAFQPL